MLISDSKRIREVQNEFNAKFPYLKIEFYTGHHEAGQGSPEKQHLDPDLTIKAARTVHNKGDMSINGHQKVKTFESNMYEQYGLNVQVFRHSGGVWLQTTATDDWTLTEQNERAASEASYTADSEIN